MRIEALGVAHGDALVVSWTGATGTPHRGLVDGGPALHYSALLRPALDSLAAEEVGGALALDFVCVSHIDDDHIGGIERLFTELRRLQRDGRPAPVQISRLWFNAWDQLGMSQAAAASVAADPVVTASVRQGADLRDAARRLRVDGNAPVGGPLLAETAFEIDGLRLTVVAPGQEQLDKLMSLWKRTEGDAAVITAAYKDRSIPNLSSIAVLVESAGRRALLTGDARGDHLLTGISSARLFADGHLHVDVLKLPHHGSINNVTAEFFEAVSADQYIVSADGVTHGLPNTECSICSSPRARTETNSSFSSPTGCRQSRRTSPRRSAGDPSPCESAATPNGALPTGRDRETAAVSGPGLAKVATRLLARAAPLPPRPIRWCPLTASHQRVVWRRRAFLATRPRVTPSCRSSDTPRAPPGPWWRRAVLAPLVEHRTTLVAPPPRPVTASREPTFGDQLIPVGVSPGLEHRTTGPG